MSDEIIHVLYQTIYTPINIGFGRVTVLMSLRVQGPYGILRRFLGTTAICGDAAP